MDHLRQEFRGTPFHLVVLAPSGDSVIAREAARGKKTVLGPKWAHYLDHELRATMTGIGLWIDTSEQTPEETVEEIIRRVWDEGLVRS
jgi:chloramphenicol 3-O-phosphotransferase